MAHFKGPIIQDQIFNLASLGMPTVEAELGNGIGAELHQFIPAEEGKWDSFFHRQSLKVLLRYSLIQRVRGGWEGVTMHSFVRWRAKHRDKDEPWELRYACFVLAACYQITAQNFALEFRRHLAVHIPHITNSESRPADLSCQGRNFLYQTFALLYHEEGQWSQTELVLLQAIEASKANHGATHPNTIDIMSKVA
ncbi:hypothetical protein N7493_005986 [Penicillium malachiteum]|uniref:Uncharacterized protein n=1 Tax=Penicillium malachiteum TaxID=1324776 RepID=A0AAD6MVZ4_9EURO|nr:hypothetical protein N7493_005986 [Penicillium malachiteum]